MLSFLLEYSHDTSQLGFSFIKASKTAMPSDTGDESESSFSFMHDKSSESSAFGFILNSPKESPASSISTTNTSSYLSTDSSTSQKFSSSKVSRQQPPNSTRKKKHKAIRPGQEREGSLPLAVLESSENNSIAEIHECSTADVDASPSGAAVLPNDDATCTSSLQNPDSLLPHTALLDESLPDMQPVGIESIPDAATVVETLQDNDAAEESVHDDTPTVDNAISDIDITAHEKLMSASEEVLVDEDGLNLSNTKGENLSDTKGEHKLEVKELSKSDVTATGSGSVEACEIKLSKIK